MNCVFCCVFSQEKYVDMFLLLLESLFIYGNIQNDTKILVYTSTPFMNKIKKNIFFDDTIIKFEINDTYCNIDKACKARLDLFNLNSINYYNKILYLDTDIIVKSDINEIFNLCKENIMYVLEEGIITDERDYWGKSLFNNDEINNYKDITAFTSGILLFNNCIEIRNLFKFINDDIVNRPYNFTCHDQPYIVYNAFKYNLYNNKLLEEFVVNNDLNENSNKIIHHFPGGPGNYGIKIPTMINFLNKLKNSKSSRLKFDKSIDDMLNSDTLNIEQDLWTCSNKFRYDIYNFFKDKINFKLAEIGSHKGYSTKVLSKIFSKVFAVDNNIEWTNFNKEFNKNLTNIEYIILDIYKDNWNTLPNDIDVVFIDAGHSYECCKSDIFNSIKTFKDLKYIIFDDYGVWDGVKKIVDELITKKILSFETFIGINDVPGPNGIVKNVNEGIICSVNNQINNQIINNITNKKYSWNDHYIEFLDNFEMNAFGDGYYLIVDDYNIVATFGGRTHNIIFNDNYDSFLSTRNDDFDTVKGKILNVII